MSVSDEERDLVFKELKKSKMNNFCVECGSANPQWASIPLGIYICYQCSGAHRSFGVHISFVRSLNMDNWTQKQLSFMKFGGNENYKSFLQTQNVDLNAPWRSKYPSRAVEIYKNKLSALVEGIEYRTPSPPKREDRKITRKADPIDTNDGWSSWDELKTTNTSSVRTKTVINNATAQTRSISTPILTTQMKTKRDSNNGSNYNPSLLSKPVPHSLMNELNNSQPSLLPSAKSTSPSQNFSQYENQTYQARRDSNAFDNQSNEFNDWESPDNRKITYGGMSSEQYFGTESEPKNVANAFPQQNSDVTNALTSGLSFLSDGLFKLGEVAKSVAKTTAEKLQEGKQNLEAYIAANQEVNAIEDENTKAIANPNDDLNNFGDFNSISSHSKSPPPQSSYHSTRGTHFAPAPTLSDRERKEQMELRRQMEALENENSWFSEKEQKAQEIARKENRNPKTNTSQKSSNVHNVDAFFEEAQVKPKADEWGQWDDDDWEAV